jgi:hypothetical protein
MIDCERLSEIKGRHTRITKVKELELKMKGSDDDSDSKKYYESNSHFSSLTNSEYSQSQSSQSLLVLHREEEHLYFHSKNLAKSKTSSNSLFHKVLNRWGLLPSEDNCIEVFLFSSQQAVSVPFTRVNMMSIDRFISYLLKEHRADIMRLKS